MNYLIYFIGLILLFCYLYPTYLYVRKHGWLNPVFLLINLLFGWTGWVWWFLIGWALNKEIDNMLRVSK